MPSQSRSVHDSCKVALLALLLHVGVTSANWCVTSRSVAITPRGLRSRQRSAAVRARVIDADRKATARQCRASEHLHCSSHVSIAYISHVKVPGLTGADIMTLCH